VTFSGVAAAPVPAPAPPPAKGAAAPVPAPAPARKAAAPAPSGKPSLARQLGLGVRRVVIDAGHGAHDPGAIGVGGLQEKDVTLDLALRVRDILRTAGYETVLTRDRDVYLPLEERTAVANTARGDLFLSLHCNSSDTGKLSGVETYYLNLASNVRSMQTAARENSMAVANMSDLQQIVREIQNSKMDESSQFAARVQRTLHDTLHRAYPDVKNLGVKQAPFYVLIGAQMPSILAEVSFINHRTEGRRLADPKYRQLIAQALADGVKRYVRTIKTATLEHPGRPTP
jgi:N-acetylmuramoyl-L-alanine amidase